MTAQAFHSLGFHWARETGMYEIEIDAEIPLVDHFTNADVVEERWKRWAAKETQLRALLGKELSHILYPFNLRSGLMFYIKVTMFWMHSCQTIRDLQASDIRLTRSQHLVPICYSVHQMPPVGAQRRLALTENPGNSQIYFTRSSRSVVTSATWEHHYPTSRRRYC